MLYGNVPGPELAHGIRVIHGEGLDGAALREQLVLQVAACGQYGIWGIDEEQTEQGGHGLHRADRVCLMQSHLGEGRGGGPRYEVIEEYPLF